MASLANASPPIALGALDGRYRAAVAPLVDHLSEAALNRERVIGLIHATEGKSDGMSKLKSALRQREDAETITVVATFTSAQLDLALGRSNVVHAALLAGPANDTFLARFARLQRFRTGGTGQGGTGRDRN